MMQRDTTEDEEESLKTFNEAVYNNSNQSSAGDAGQETGRKLCQLHPKGSWYSWGPWELHPEPSFWENLWTLSHDTTLDEGSVRFQLQEQSLLSAVFKVHVSYYNILLISFTVEEKVEMTQLETTKEIISLWVENY